MLEFFRVFRFTTSKDKQGLKSHNFHQCLPMDSLLYAIGKKLVQVIEFIQNLTFAMILLPSVVYLKD